MEILIQKSVCLAILLAKIVMEALHLIALLVPLESIYIVQLAYLYVLMVIMLQHQITLVKYAIQIV